MAARERSASPSTETRPKKQKTGGFKWKEKRARADEEDFSRRDSGHLERGYRDRSPRKDSYRDRHDDRFQRNRGLDERQVRREDGNERLREQEKKPAGASDPDGTTTADTTKPPIRDSASKPKKPKKPLPTSTEPMIVVNVNDRLGTKAAIPCLASDSVKAFKTMVAMHIGRQPHEIMIKRQGERPFKDQLTLEDYGVSNGVQLDLELDTGD